MPHDIFLNLFKVLARAAKVIFVCCFRDPRGLLSSDRDHVSPPNIESIFMSRVEGTMSKVEGI